MFHFTICSPNKNTKHNYECPGGVYKQSYDLLHVKHNFSLVVPRETMRGTI